MWNVLSGYPRQSLDSGFHAVDFGLQVLDSGFFAVHGTCILDSNRYSGIPNSLS